MPLVLQEILAQQDLQGRLVMQVQQVLLVLLDLQETQVQQEVPV